MNILRQISSVMWSFIGLAGPRDRVQGARGSPLVIVAVAFVLVLLFLGTLAFIAHAVVKPA